MMQFAKWHGLGNDYIVLRDVDIPAAITAGVQPVRLSAAAARAMCDRHTGIGGDGVLIVGVPDHADFAADLTMWIHNPDGSDAEMCGNGIRMVARYAQAHGLVDRDELRIWTPGGVVTTRFVGDGLVAVDMGRVQLADRRTVLTDGGAFDGRPASIGNPHFVLFVNPAEIEFELVGRQIEHDPAFPNRTNVEFVTRDNASSVTMRVWERGVGETRACGSGACAVAAVAVADADCSSPLTVHLVGGDLQMTVAPDHAVTMTGPAREIYRGETDLSVLEIADNEEITV